MRKRFTQEKYDKIRRYYWIAAFKNDRENTSKKLRFSLEKPKQMGNTRMDWYHPTYIELLEHNERMWGEVIKRHKKTRRENKIAKFDGMKW